MEDWEAARDAKTIEYLEDMENSSYDFVARDIWFRNGAKADLLRYRHQNREFKVIGIYEPAEGENAEGEEMIEALRDIGDLLISEGFKYEISSMRSDTIEYEENCALEGDYRLHTKLEDTVVREIEDLFAVPDIYGSLSPIKCK